MIINSQDIKHFIIITIVAPSQKQFFGFFYIQDSGLVKFLNYSARKCERLGYSESRENIIV